MRFAIIFACLLAALVAVVLIVLTPSPPAKVVGQEITSEEINNTPDSVFAAAPASICSGACSVSEKNRLRVLIFNRWMQLQADSDRVVVPDAQIQALYRANLGVWRQSGRGAKPTPEAARYALLADRLSRKISVDPKTVADLAKQIARQQPKVNQTPDSVYRNLQVVKTDSESAALQARSALERGDDIARVVRRYGVNRQDPSNYDLKDVQSGTLGSAIEQQLRLVRPGVIVGPVESDGYWWVINYLSFSNRGPDRGPLARYIFDQARQQAQLDSLPTYLSKRWSRKTSCRASLASDFCGQKD